MRNAFIFHGKGGSPRENWFPWLKEELQELGYKAYAPAFPTPENQTLEAWDKVFAPFREKLNEESILIAHSVAPLFVLHLLQNIQVEVRACFFVSGFVSPLGNEELDATNRNFLEQEIQWQAVKHHCRDFILFHAEDDPHVPVEKAEELNSHLHGELITREEGGHFNTDSGYTEFPELLEKIKEY